MKSWFLSLFSESSDVSMGRFLSFVCVAIAGLVAIYSVARQLDLNAASVLCGTFLAAGISGKVISKFAENGDKT